VNPPVSRTPNPIPSGVTNQVPKRSLGTGNKLTGMDRIDRMKDISDFGFEI
jgi:hypothetical protein